MTIPNFLRPIHKEMIFPSKFSIPSGHPVRNSLANDIHVGCRLEGYGLLLGLNRFPAE